MSSKRAGEPGLDLSATYLHILGDGAVPIEVDESFWPELMGGNPTSDGPTRVMQGGWLVTCFHSTGDTPHWEMHPNGEEILFLVDGAIDIVLDDGSGAERIVSLEPQRACLVPRGVWHRQVVREPGHMIAMTCGEGTQHRPA